MFLVLGTYSVKMDHNAVSLILSGTDLMKVRKGEMWRDDKEVMMEDGHLTVSTDVSRPGVLKESNS